MTSEGEQPLFWWWPAEGNNHCVAVLIADALIVTEPMAPAALEGLELARREGAIGPEHLGDEPTIVPLQLIEETALDSAGRLLHVVLRSGVVDIAAPASVLAGIHRQLVEMRPPKVTKSWVNGLSDGRQWPPGTT